MSTLYQLTPGASKNNAFCWLTWAPQINWRNTTLSMAEIERHNDHRESIERKRSEGIDPLHIAGLGKNTQRDPMRFSTLSSWRKRA